MPINHSHAFANGTSRPITPVSRSMLFRLRSLAFRMTARWLQRVQMSAAAETFRERAIVGTGCRVGPSAHCINLGARERITIGNGVICRGILRCENRGDARLLVGDNVYIGDDCIISCAERIEIGCFALLAHGVQVFDNDTHPTDPLSREQDYMAVREQPSGPRPPVASAPVWIGDRAWVGFNSIVLKGVRIGEGSIVGAGSVVTSDVPSHTVVAGSPARIVKKLDPEDFLPPDETGAGVRIT